MHDDPGGRDAAAPEPPASTPARPSRRRRLLPAVVVPVLLVALTGSLFLVDRSSPPVSGGGAARFLPPDGHSVRARDAQGAVDTVEHARLTGVEGLLTAPDAVASAVLGSLEDTVTGAQLWRETLTAADGSQYSDLYLVDDGGIREVAAWGGFIGFTFSPGLLMLPADVRAGAEWSSSGSALADGALTYRADYRATEAPPAVATADGGELAIADGCLQVDGTLTIAQPESGPVLESAGTSIWCPGQGRVFSSGEQNGQPIGSAIVDAGTPLSEAAPREAPAGEAPTVAAGGRVRPLEAIAPDPFFGESVKQGSVPVAPAVAADGSVLVANDRGDDLQSWAPGHNTATLEWSAHPGGVIVSVSAVGDVALVGTSERAVHAYDGIGRRLWTWHGAELTLAPALPAGGGATPTDVVLVSRDGRITKRGLDDGAERWTAELGADARGTAVMTGGLLVIGDERGRLSGIETDTGALRWRSDVGIVERLAATPGSDPASSADVVNNLYAATFDGALLALNPETGAEIWSDGYPGAVTSLSATGSVSGSGSGSGVILGTDERLLGYDALGVETWRSDGVQSIAHVASGWEARGGLTVAGQTLTLTGEDGTVSGSWELPDGSSPAGGHLLGHGDGLLFVDSFLAFVRLEAP